MEMAIVMLIVALLLGGMMLPLSAQQDLRNNAETQKAMVEARDALLGFAVANDRLPCPASATSNGVESPSGGGACTDPHGGFLPAVTLGLSVVDASGYGLDGWGSSSSNRIRYGVTTSNSNAFTSVSGMKTITMTTLAPDLKVCNSGANVVSPGTSSATCSTGNFLALDAVAVIYSLGKNAATGGNGASESHNPNPTNTIAADPAYVNAEQGSDFDDQIVWLSKNTLFHQMISAGRLP